MRDVGHSDGDPRCACDECSRRAAQAWTAYYRSDDFQVGVIPPEFRRDFDPQPDSYL